MITAADEIFIDFSTSCTRDVAVAKLLGWMQGPIRRRCIIMTEDGISEDQLPYLHKLEDPVKDLLLELRDAAQQRLYKAFDEDNELSSEESRQLLSDAVDDVERLSQKTYLAAQYFRAIDDELAKGDESELRVDKTATIALNNPYIALSSLDTWAKRNYQISIFLERDVVPTVVDVIDQLKQQKADLREDGGLNKVKADNLYTSFAFLVEAFSKSLGAYHNDNGPNVIAISKKIEKLAKEAYGDKEFLPGQGHEAIKKNIGEAMRRKKLALITK